MKVAFYIPPIPDGNTTPALGPLCLIGVLEKAGFDGRLFDARIDSRALQKLRAFQPDMVGVSAVTSGYPGGLRAAKVLKEAIPGIPVVFGGAHPSSLPCEVISEPAVDYVVVGEAEAALPMLCARVLGGNLSAESLKEVRNLVFKDGSEIVRTEKGPFLGDDDLDRLPWPDFDRMDLDTYFRGTQTHGLFSRGKRILPIMTTRGCPDNCTFCCRVMGQKIRSRSVESVMAEIEHLVKTYGVDEIYFEDDNFTTKRDRALDILDRLAARSRPIFLKFANGIRADRVDRELLAAMKKAGVYSLSFGIESGCPGTLEKMRKRLDLEKAKANISLAKSMGFLVGSNCILGYPGETPEDIETSVKFFMSLPLDSMAIVNLVPFPGTEVRALCEKEGYLTEAAQDWSNYYFSVNDPIPLIETPVLSGAELTVAIHRAYRRMYLRPQWIWRCFRYLSLHQILAGGRTLLGIGAKRRSCEEDGGNEAQRCVPSPPRTLGCGDMACGIRRPGRDATEARESTEES